MDLKSVNKVAIIGVGFMGGSLACALKEKFFNLSIWGYARSQKSYRKLSKLGFLDAVETSLKNLVQDADVIILALPVKAIISCLKGITPFLKDKAVVFDLGSSKQEIEKAAKKYLPKNVSFVGCHPLCGSEKSGAEFSDKNLYKDSLCLITSSPKQKAVESVKKMWEELGSKVIFISPGQHDKALSQVSHLPHAVSFCLTNSIDKGYLKFSGSGLKGVTRISGSPAQVWADIFFSNKRNVLKDLKSFIKELEKFEALLKSEDKDKLVDLIKKANVRQKSLNGQKNIQR